MSSDSHLPPESTRPQANRPRSASRSAGLLSGLLSFLIGSAKVLLPLLLLVGGFFIAKTFIANRPPPKIVAPEELVPTVDVITSAPSFEQIIVDAEGLVEPLWQAGLSAQVAGQVLDVSAAFQAGRHVSKGEVLVSIERVQYAANVARAKAAVATARRVVAEELALGGQGLKEWIRSGRHPEDVGELTIRKPQIDAAEADLASAEANLQTAALDLERTLVRAPFDGVVESRSVSPGDVVSLGRSLGSLLGSDVFEARLTLSPSDAALLPLPSPGAPQAGQAAAEPLRIELTSSSFPGRSWVGEITRTEARIDPQNRLVTCVAEVKNPLANPDNLLPAGAFVTASIPGRMLTGVQLVPESAVFENRFVWVVETGTDAEGERATVLTREDVRREFTRDGKSCVRFARRPLESRQVVVQPLPSYQSGMKVMPRDNAENANKAATTKPVDASGALGL